MICVEGSTIDLKYSLKRKTHGDQRHDCTQTSQKTSVDREDDQSVDDSVTTRETSSRALEKVDER